LELVMAFFVSGVTFSPGDQVTAVKLNNLVNDATPINFTRSAFAPDSKIVTVGTDAPASPTPGELYFNSTDSSLNLFLDAATRVGLYPQEMLMTTQSNTAIGDVVILDPGNNDSVQTTTTDAAKPVIGIAKEAITSSPSSCRLQIAGKCLVNCDDTAVNTGDYLYTSTTEGKARGSASYSTGAFAIALESKGLTAGPVLSLLFSSASKGARTTVTASLTDSTELFNVPDTAGTWYDVPGPDAYATLPSNNTTVSQDGSNAFAIEFTTKNNNTQVLLQVSGLGFIFNNNQMFASMRYVLDGNQIVYYNKQYGIVGTYELSGTNYNSYVYGPVRMGRSGGGQYSEITINFDQVWIDVPTAGTHKIWIQFEGAGSGTHPVYGFPGAELKVTYED
jgi:hypothetical protein